MKKAWILVGCIGLIIIAAMLYVALNGKKISTPSYQQQGTTQSTEKETPAESTPPAAPTPGTYEAYNAEVVAKDANRKILFFHAEWCPQCRQLDQNFKTSTLPDNVSIYKVNYDTAGELRQKYGVTMQTTFVEIDSEGREVQKHVAYFEPTLDAVVREMKLK